MCRLKFYEREQFAVFTENGGFKKFLNKLLHWVCFSGKILNVDFIIVSDKKGSELYNANKEIGWYISLSTWLPQSLKHTWHKTFLVRKKRVDDIFYMKLFMSSFFHITWILQNTNFFHLYTVLKDHFTINIYWFRISSSKPDFELLLD